MTKRASIDYERNLIVTGCTLLILAISIRAIAVDIGPLAYVVAAFAISIITVVVLRRLIFFPTTCEEVEESRGTNRVTNQTQDALTGTEDHSSIPINQKQARVFVSHSSEDKPFVRRLIADLSERDIPLWFDEQEISLGDSIPSSIGKGLEASDYIIVVLSKSSVVSPWVSRELDTAFIKEIDEKAKLILPILIEDCDVPLLLRSRLWADFRTDYRDGLKSILRVLKQEANPSALNDTLSSFSDSCIQRLESLSHANIRRMITPLRRTEISVIWFDAGFGRMDDDMAFREKGECITELLLRANDKGKLKEVFESICHDHSSTIDHWFQQRPNL